MSLVALGFFFSLAFARFALRSLSVLGVEYYRSPIPRVSGPASPGEALAEWRNSYEGVLRVSWESFASQLAGDMWVLLLFSSLVVSIGLHTQLQRLRSQVPFLLYRLKRGPLEVMAYSILQGLLFSATLLAPYLSSLASVSLWTGIVSVSTAFTSLDVLALGLLLLLQPPLYTAIFMVTGRVDSSLLSLAAYSVASGVAWSSLGLTGLYASATAWTLAVIACLLVAGRRRWSH
ncbi:MAG: hypothetical protein LRS43_03120 [Desulfurococcales archaeon]|nr:hypothetical protein [Desulfurococcales archaeon]